MNSRRGKRWLAFAGGTIVLILIGILAAARRFQVWSWRDFKVFQMMSRECHPVWKELNSGRVYLGQDVDEVIAHTNPISVERYGPYATLYYQKGLCFTGVDITAKNGRLFAAAAWSCTWDKKFFDELTENDQKNYSDLYEEHWRPIRAQREADVKGEE